MTALRLVGLTKSYGHIAALRNVDLDIPAGTLTAILGPSGCGKTTLLRCVAGLERPDRGEVHVAGDAVTRVPAHRRRIAIVPQEGGLFPHLTVAANVAFGLDRATRSGDRVDEVLALVGLADHGARWPHQLSGGQQQRVAVARALAPRPPLILLDEPFSALDATLRADLRRDVREALLADGATALLVTHDQDEALSMADLVAVMRDGSVVQAGPPADIYQSPLTPWVARFVGDAVSLSAERTPEGFTTPLGKVAVADPPAGDRFTVLVRPEQIRFSPNGHGITATILNIEYHGHDLLVSLQLPDTSTVVARVPGTTAAERGGTVRLVVDGAALLHTT
ncbi:ABC transporter ATP-binding protein [Lentzea sp. NPDC058436]|uniref:ABC transporter ATP-binding protein n=1 Tax=Lentzea sp. NPDC058436 TaxID=3346499 RepID=UPI0036696338